MTPPFTLDQFLGVFESYNRAVSVAPFFLAVLAAVIVGMLYSRYQLKRGIVPYVLALFWLWMGIVYHILFFSRINPAALPFGVVFVVQALMFVVAGARRWIQFEAAKNLRTIVGAGVMAYGLVAYPIIGAVVGHGYPLGPVFGAPCPTTIFTFGVLITSKQKYPAVLLVIPVLWSFLATQVLSLGIYEDAGLPLSAVLATASRWLDRERTR